MRHSRCPILIDTPSSTTSTVGCKLATTALAARQDRIVFPLVTREGGLRRDEAVGSRYNSRSTNFTRCTGVVVAHASNEETEPLTHSTLGQLAATGIPTASRVHASRWMAHVKSRATALGKACARSFGGGKPPGLSTTSVVPLHRLNEGSSTSAPCT